MTTTQKQKLTALILILLALFAVPAIAMADDGEEIGLELSSDESGLNFASEIARQDTVTVTLIAANDRKPAQIDSQGTSASDGSVTIMLIKKSPTSKPPGKK